MVGAREAGRPWGPLPVPISLLHPFPFWARRASPMASSPKEPQHPPHILAARIRGFQERKIRKTIKISKQWYFYPSYASTVNAKAVCRSGQKEGGLKKD